MALTQLDTAPDYDKTQVHGTQTVTAVAGGATTLGGTYSMRLLIDDAVALSKNDVLVSLKAIEQRIKEDTWPPSLAINAG